MIFVANIPTVMEVGGEVNVPGFYKYVAGRRVNDYIDLAGGFTQNAEKKIYGLNTQMGDRKNITGTSLTLKYWMVP